MKEGEIITKRHFKPKKLKGNKKKKTRQEEGPKTL
jgi:hypothetical protein